MRRPPPSSPLWTAAIGLASLTCCLVVFYAVPITRDDVDSLGVGAILLAAGGLVALLALVAAQVRRQIRAGRDPSVRVQSIVGLLAPVVVFFAGVYYAIEVAHPGAFVGIGDRTDALYFTVVTMGTVGFGDVHPVGQGAKIATMVQIVVDLVLIGAVVSAATSRARGREALRAARRADADRGPGAQRGANGSDQE